MNRHDQDLAAERYVPSPSERARDQVALYEATGGREGGTLEGRPVVILTTTGATSGTIRETPIMRIERNAPVSPSPPPRARPPTRPGTTT